MRIAFLFAFFIWQSITTLTNGQCPNSAFNSPDTVCKGSVVPFTINPSGPNQVIEWDYNCGDSKNQPQINISGNYPSTIPGTSGFDFLEENGVFIGFSVRSLGLMRLEFGNSLSNAPVVTDLGTVGVIGGGTQDLKLLKEGNDYYALINTSSGNMIRISFGNSLLNTPTGDIITLPANLFSFPFNMDLERMGSDIVAVVANISGQNLTIVNFGISITNNNPTAFTIPVPGASPIAPVLVNDCGNLHAIVAYFSGAAMTRVSFGNAVTATPIQTVNFNVNSLWAYRQANMIQDGLEWLLFANTSGGDQIHVYRFGEDPTNLSPAITFPIAASSQDFSTAAFKKYGSELAGIACNNSTGDIRRIQYPEAGICTPTSSTGQQTSTVFNSSGYFYVNCSVTDTLTGLVSAHLDSIFVAEAPTASFITGTGCLNAPTSFTNTSSLDAVSFQWSFGDGETDNTQNPSHLYDQPGSYEVTLTAANASGCYGEITDSIFIVEQPIAGFNFSNNACAGTPIGLSDSSTTSTGTIVSWSWLIANSDTLSGPTPPYSFTSSGQFDIKLVVQASTGCFDTSSAICSVLPGPIAGFQSTSTCLGDSVKFINTTILAGGLNTDYLWRFSILDSSTLEEPVFQFPATSAADYLIRMAATSSNGCTDTADAIVHIGPAAIVDFGIDDDTVCTASPVTFSDSSFVSPTESIVERIWDFGDGQQAFNIPAVTHSYSSPGLYQVTLTVRTATDCLSSASKSVTVINSPSAGFSTQSVCEDINIVFSDTSISSPATQITAWSWTFDTLATSTSQSPVFLFSDPGYYSITLSVADDNGCSSEVTTPLLIQQRPAAGFLNSNACSNSTVSFTDTSRIAGSSLVSWTWDFGDGSAVSNSQNPAHVFQNTGAYNTQLITTSSYGCTDTASKIIVVDQSPQFTLLPSQACYGQDNSFSYNFTNISVTNPAYIWDFGDSTFSLQSSPVHLYGSPGLKNVILSITDLDNGCVWTDSINAVVLENPSADFPIQPICENDTLTLTDQSTGTTNDPIVSWTWTSGIFPAFYNQNVNIPGIGPGIYQIQLLVTSGSGCKDSIAKNLQVYDLPQTQFSASPYFGAPPLVVQFTNQSEPGSSIWDFNDGSATSSIRSPIHTFQDTGTFLVTLRLTDTLGCTGFSQNEIIVLQPFLDLAVSQIEFNESNDTYSIKTRLRNNGNNTVTSFRILLELNSKSPVIEKAENVEILPGSTFDFVSSIAFVKDGTTPEYVCAELISVNDTMDEVPSNDRKCLAFTDDTELFNPYPNPVFDLLNIPVYTQTQGRIEISITDMSGKKTAGDKSLYIPKGLTVIELETRNLSAGQYILRATLGAKEFTVPFIKCDRP